MPTTLVGSRISTRPLARMAAVYVLPSGAWTLAVESLLETGSENWRSTTPGVAPSRCPGSGLDDTSEACAEAVRGSSAAPRPAASAASRARESQERLLFISSRAPRTPTLRRDQPVYHYAVTP